MKTPTIRQHNPLYVGDIVAKFKSQGLIKVAHSMSPKQIDALKMSLIDRRRKNKTRTSK